MGKTAYFDMFSGISGNMILGAFLDLGISEESFRGMLKKIPISGYEIKIESVKKHGIKGIHLDVLVMEEQPHRHLIDIKNIINQSTLKQEVKELALKIFTRLAEAEAKIHDTTIEKIHFHEVGAVDAIIDILGAAWCINELEIDNIYASPINTGSGMVKCAHGFMPIPAPATQELLKGTVSYASEIKKELATPTGVAIITTLTESYGSQPEMKVEKVSYGAGTWDLEIPNLLRIVIGEEIGEEIKNDKKEEIFIVETNIDDMIPEFYDYIFLKLFESGALDVYYTSIGMKKNRPGMLLTVLTMEENLDNITNTILKETTSIGIRSYKANRVTLERESMVINTKYGDVRVKISKKNNRILSAKPEYDDCKNIAIRTEKPLKEIWQEISNILKEKIDTLYIGE